MQDERIFILSKLPVYTGKVNVISEDQTVRDIINGVKYCHNKYSGDYDKIGDYFIKNTPEETCENIFDFLRASSFYYVEGDDKQTLRSPSAILSTGKTIGIDCKNYALFIGGVLDAINRTGKQYIPFVYRFASDKLFDSTPNHVFIVAYPGTDNEIWVDPIPEVGYFNEKLTYYSYTDKNFSKMALQIISGRKARVGGGLFNFGANKLQSEMTSFINQYALAFMYLFLPTGATYAQEYGFNLGTPVPGVPQIIKDKQLKAFQTMWNWGDPTGLKAQSDIVNAIRAAIVAKIGMQPETYWGNMLGITIPLHAAIGATSIDPANSPYTQVLSTASNAIFPGAGTLATFALSAIDSLVPDLTMTWPPSTFAPAIGDWDGTPYANNFVQTPGTTNLASSSSNLFIYAIIGGIVLLIFTKK